MEGRGLSPGLFVFVGVLMPFKCWCGGSARMTAFKAPAIIFKFNNPYRVRKNAPEIHLAVRWFPAYRSRKLSG